MKIKQILFSAITLLCFLVIAPPVAAFDVTINKVVYSCNPEDKTAMLTDGGASTGDLEIPSTIEVEGKTYTVNSIKESAFSKYYGSGVANITSITIPNTVTSIGSRAFHGCSKLKHVTLPNALKSIASDLFRGCESLDSINIPNSVTNIGNAAFIECRSLKSVNIPNSVTSIERNAFSQTGLSSIIIPSSVTVLDGGAFYNTPLTSVLIEGVLKEVGYAPFSHCGYLKEIKFPSKQIADANKPVYKTLLLYNNVATYGISTPAGSSSFSLPVPARLPMGAEKEYGSMEWRGDNLVNSAGKVVFNRAKYDDVLYQNPAIIVCKNGKWGAISYSGKVLAAPKYGRYEGYGRGRLLFSNKTTTGGHYFIIAPTGAVLANRVFKNSEEYLFTSWVYNYMSHILRD